MREATKHTRPKLEKRSAKLGPIVILLLTSAYPLSAATVTVCPSGCDSTTIQGAVTMADAGDVAQILSSQAHTESDIYVTKDITVAGFGVLDTIVQADAASGTATLPVFVIVAGARLTLESLTVRHGGGERGGAVDIEDGHAVLTDVQLAGGCGQLDHGQHSPAWRWCLQSRERRDHRHHGEEQRGHNPVRRRRRWRRVQPRRPHGSLLDGSGSVTLDRVSLYYNEARNGGGVYHDGGDLMMEDCTIKMNTATISGGGLFLDHFGLASATIAHSTVVDNQALVAGGVEVVGDGVTRIFNSTLSGNSATDDAGGLGLSDNSYVATASTTITDNGGPTETHALDIGSPAIDASDPAGAWIPSVGLC